MIIILLIMSAIKKIVIFGSTGNTGLCAVRAAVNAGNQLYPRFARSYATSVPQSANQEAKLEILEGENAGIAILGLNRPESKNAISRNLLKELVEALDVVRGNKNVRTLI